MVYEETANTPKKAPNQYKDLKISWSKSSKTVLPAQDWPFQPNLPSVAQEKDNIDKIAKNRFGTSIFFRTHLSQKLTHKKPAIMAEKMIINENNNFLRNKFNLTLVRWIPSNLHFCFLSELAVLNCSFPANSFSKSQDAQSSTKRPVSKERKAFMYIFIGVFSLVLIHPKLTYAKASSIIFFKKFLHC